jgi:hypothetical protein
MLARSGINARASHMEPRFRVDWLPYFPWIYILYGHPSTRSVGRAGKCRPAVRKCCAVVGGLLSMRIQLDGNVGRLATYDKQRRL